MTAPGLVQVPLKTVTTPTGATLEVMGDAEEQRYLLALQAYTDGVKYTEHSDLEDLERILSMELMVFRWGRWLLSGKEYDGTFVTNEGELRRWINDYSVAITRIKESLKLDRKSREGDKSANFHERWTNLAQHAKEFGVMREKQLGRALEIMQGLFALVATFDRCDEEERRVLGFPDADSILQYLRECRPEYEAIDAHFRQNSQRFWIRKP